VVICETERLRVRRFSLDDAAFILRLLNDPSFIRHIADKGVRTLDDARAYLRNGPLASVEKHGFGLNRVELKESGEAIGMCGLIHRDAFDDVDVGYALLPAFCGQGYALEATRAVLDSAVRHHGLQRVIAVVNPDNVDSSRMLEKLGFHFEKMVKLEPNQPEIRQFAIALSPCLRLTPGDAKPYRALMLEAYAQHLDAFTSSVAEREALPLSWWQARLSAAPDAKEVVFGAFHSGVLVGAVGLSFDAREKALHKATLFGMVVSAAQRRLGLGQRLVTAALDCARSRPGVRLVQLTVTQGNVQAQTLYARNGFVEFGVEPYAVAVGQEFVSKVHMWRKL
jgi:RimJ/RimL family protein N-acetyltransferase